MTAVAEAPLVGSMLRPPAMLVEPDVVAYVLD
jgi:hypothetical protein